MAFNPDDYLAEEQDAATSKFDPDAYLSEEQDAATSKFDPDAYLSDTKTATTSDLIRMRRGAPVMETETAATTADLMAQRKPLREVFGAPSELAVTPEYQPEISPTAFEEQSVDMMGVGDENIQTANMLGDGSEPRSYSLPEDVAKNKDTVKKVRDYLKVRYPNITVAKSDVGIIKQFQERQTKTDMDIAEDATWVYNASNSKKKIAYDAFKAVEAMPPMPTSFVDETVAALQSPTSYYGGVAGFIARKAAIKAGASALKTMVATAGATVVVDASTTAATNTQQQKTRMATAYDVVDEQGNVVMEQPKEIAVYDDPEAQLVGEAEVKKAKPKQIKLQEHFDYQELAIVTGITAAFSAAGGTGIAAAASDPKKQMAAIMSKKKPPDAAQKATVDFLQEFQDREKEIYLSPLFESPEQKAAARSTTLDTMDPPDKVTNAVLDTKTVKMLYDTAKEVFATNPELIPTDFRNRRVTEVVTEVLSNVDEQTLEQAASKAGVSTADLLDAFKVSLSDAGTVLQQGSQMAKFLERMVKGGVSYDPELEKIFTRLYKAGHGQEYLSDSPFKVVRSITGAGTGAAVAGLSTTQLNIFGMVGTVTVKTAVDTIEGVQRVFSKMVGDMRGRAPVQELRLKETTDQLIGDSFRVLGHIFDSGLSDNLFKILSKQHPKLFDALLSASPEGDRAMMGRFVTTVNSINRAVESYVRKPVFIAMLRERMDKVGLDFEDFVANDKAIPVGLLNQAYDDTLELTFSNRFKPTTEKGIEAGFNNMAADFVNTINKNDMAKITADFIAPFFKFSLSLAKYHYRLTPMSGAGGALEIRRASKLLKESNKLAAAGKIDAAVKMKIDAQGLAYKGKQKVLTSAVGTGMIAYLMGVREDNADLPAHMMRDRNGEVHDIGPLSPMTGLLQMADISLYARDLAKNYYYTLTMTDSERAKEAVEIRKEANSLPRDDKRKQEMLNTAELIGNGRLRNFDPVKFSEFMFGFGRMAGTQKTFLDSIKETSEDSAQGEEGGKESPTGRFIGDFVSRYDNVLNPLYDLFSAASDDLRQRDSRDAETLGFGAFADELINAVAKSMPTVREDRMKEKPSLFQSTTPQVANAFRYLTGEKSTTPTTKIENELLRLGIEPWKVYPKEKDRAFNNEIIRLAQPEIRVSVGKLIASPDYKGLSKAEQTLALEGEIRRILNEAKKDVEDNIPEEEIVDRKYRAMNKKEKKAAQDRFFRIFKRRPTTIEDKQNILDGDYNMAKDLIDNFASGGLATQTKRAFSK
jgi:hypothetical protein